MAHRSFSDAGHLPKRRESGLPADPEGLPRQRVGITPQMHATEIPHIVDSLAVQTTVAENALRLAANRPVVVPNDLDDIVRTIALYSDAGT